MPISKIHLSHILNVPMYSHPLHNLKYFKIQYRAETVYFKIPMYGTLPGVCHKNIFF